MTTTCHPATAWAAMARGMSLYAIASRYRDTAGALDLAVWRWRHERTVQLYNERKPV
jgi:hypothetical protein